MSDDDLRRRLAALDPMAASRVPEPLPSGRAARILEDTMTQLDERPAVSPWYRRGAVQLAAAAAAVLAVGGGVALMQGTAATPAGDGSTLTLSVPGGDVMASCLPFDVDFLATMSPAFAGTVTDVNAETVTIDVDRWYVGGDASVVLLQQPDPMSSIALDGVDFVDGQRYLVTAGGGTVNGCGFSGLATPELEAAFAEAFGG